MNLRKVIPLSFGDHELKILIRQDKEGYLSIMTPCSRMGLSYQAQASFIRHRFPGFFIEEEDSGRFSLFLSKRKIGAWLYLIQPDDCPSDTHRRQLTNYQDRLDDAIADLLEGRTVSLKDIDPAEVLVQMALQLRDQGKRLKAVESKSEEALKYAEKALEDGNRDPNTRTILAFLKRWKKYLNEWEASALGNKASAECRRRGIPIGKVPDARFDTVNTYPIWFLEEFFTREFGSKPT